MECYCAQASFNSNRDHPINHECFQVSLMSNSYIANTENLATTVTNGVMLTTNVATKQTTFRAYHKSHINKTMGISFVAFAFDDNMENGGEAMKFAFLRAQSHTVTEKEVREAVRQEDGSIKYNGPIRRQKGDTHLGDCCVTGSKEGSVDDPKFPLKLVFEHVILVGPGGHYEGRTVIIQGDNMPALAMM
jgi:hypothetical protein